MVVWAASITYLVISTTTSGMVMIEICTDKRNVVVQICLRIAPSIRADAFSHALANWNTCSVTLQC